MKRLISGLLPLALALALTQAAAANPPRRGPARQVERHNFVDRNSFAAANRHFVRAPHGRAWWVAHYPHTRFVLFGGGYYFWWGGYWYPAYGYDSYYSTYPYDSPIYGYNNYAPGQVIENVQVALRDQGYYRGPIDGLVGPQTRAALVNYQRSHGLVVTAAIDQPTLVTLGLA
ncbi:MAG: peptidoglycan-binding protein [Chthoniobacterales bacterium]